MQLFSTTGDHTVLCDTPLCFGEVRQLPPQTPITPSAASPAEVVLCVLDGELAVDVAHDGGEEAHFLLGAMEGLQIPVGQHWQGQAGAAGAKVLRVDSFHPHFAPEQRLMPALAQPHRFAVADGEMLVYTDHVRGGVLNFRPGFAADKHFHQDADELFWFFQGQCRVVTPDGEVLAPAGTIVYTAPGEWHIIDNPGPEALLMFVTVTPNIVPSHTFFDAEGNPSVRSWAPLRGTVMPPLRTSPSQHSQPPFSEMHRCHQWLSIGAYSARCLAQTRCARSSRTGPWCSAIWTWKPRWPAPRPVWALFLAMPPPPSVRWPRWSGWISSGWPRAPKSSVTPSCHWWNSFRPGRRTGWVNIVTGARPRRTLWTRPMCCNCATRWPWWTESWQRLGQPSPPLPTNTPRRPWPGAPTCNMHCPSALATNVQPGSQPSTATESAYSN